MTSSNHDPSRRDEQPEEGACKMEPKAGKVRQEYLELVVATKIPGKGLF
jgi:hypothetical protein